MYEQLAEQCQKFAVDLLDQTRSLSELLTILNYEATESAARESFGRQDNAGSGSDAEEKMRLVRLKLAVKCNQKRVSIQI
jgi:hypothetical protein